MKKKGKKIGIDARLYGPSGKGLGRYIQEVVDNILKIDQDNDYIIFLHKDNFDEFQTKKNNVKKVKVNARWYTLKEQIIFPYLILKENLDLVHFPHFNVPVFTPTKFVVTIHDLILTKFPTIRASTLGPLLYRIKNLAYKVVIKLAIKRSKKVITVSEFTKKDILKQFETNPEKIEVTYEGVANLIKDRDSLLVSGSGDTKTLLSYNIDNNFLLYVGNAYPHKNLEGLIKVFVELNKNNPDISLVLVGKHDYFYQRLKIWVKENYSDLPIIFTGYVPDEKLGVFYQKALVYVFPSLYEGFGLPPLEAMSRGCAVVSSNRSSMPEILGEAAMYFDPENEKEMIGKIEKAIQDEQLREGLVKKGKLQVKKYSWQECAKETLEIYNNV